MRVHALRLACLALLIAACATPVPPSVRVGDIRALAGEYSGTLQEQGELDRSARLIVQPDGQFELAASDPRGFRTGGRMAILADGTVVYEYPEMRGAGQVARGRVSVHDGDGRRVLILTKNDGTMTTRVSRPAP